MRSAYITHPDCLRHEMGHFHPESPQRVTAIADRLLSRGLLDWMEMFEAPAATRAQVLRAHSAAHYDRLRAIAPAEGLVNLDPDTAMNPFTLSAALHAAGAAVKAADLVLNDGFQRVFCNVRPPGHHAEHDQPMGFCFFNSVAIGIHQALAEGGLTRIALVDFDVHHGNGSEEIFAGDDRVLMVSTFQSPLYPFVGDVPKGENMCNVPLAPYSDGQAMRDAVESRWLPALAEFEPQMIWISAGFDAHREDDISHLMWRDADYDWVTRQIVEVAERYSEGRIVSSLEGGYNLPALARSAELHVRALIGAD
jgi:acetoin utilization deacetylase AcuC-like enzyme